MQISATTAPVTAYPFDRQAAAKDAKAQDAAADQAKKDAEKQEAAKVFTPAPPLRPNIQDYVDINRTLIALRRI